MRALLAAALLLITFLATTPLDYPLRAEVNDKVQHLAAFFGLAFLADHAFPKGAWSWRKAAPLLAYGAALEILQYFIPGRYLSLADLGADAIGLWLYGLSQPLLHRLPFKSQRPGL
jgi:VanZ family protein